MKIIQYILLILVPFYPIWAALFYTLTHRHVDYLGVLVFLLLAFVLIIIQKIRIPKYLIFFILFTIYHICSIFINGLIPADANLITFLLTDVNVFACIAFFVIENTDIEISFLKKMNICLAIIVIVSLIVSIVQIKFPTFFVSPAIEKNVEWLLYIQQKRIFSIFSWTNLNSVGISFPIIIAILLSVYNNKMNLFPWIVVSGIVVTFLTRARYAMLGAVVAFSQLFFVSKIPLKRKISFLFIFAVGVILLINIAKIAGFDVQQVVSDRILEQGSQLGSARARLVSLEVFLIKFPEHPWFGVGPSTRADVVQLLGGVAPLIHVGYLSYLYFYGILGFSFLLAAILFLLKDAWMAGTKNMFWGSFYGLLIFCLANATMVFFNFSEFGILLLVLYLKYFKQKKSVESSTGYNFDSHNTELV